MLRTTLSGVRGLPAAAQRLCSRGLSSDLAAGARSPLVQRSSQRSRSQLQAVFTCGVPAAGKTHILNRVFGWWSDRLMIDLDDEIERHPQYDPLEPHRIYELREAYEWADARVAERFAKALEARVPRRLLVYDGTGTKVATRLERMDMARRAGFTVSLLYVRVRLETARQRNALRTRRVPDDILQTYFARIERTFELEAPHADEVFVVDNDATPDQPDDHALCLPHSPIDGIRCLTPLRLIPRVVADEVLPDEPHGGGLPAESEQPGGAAHCRPRDSDGCVIQPDPLGQ